MSNHIINAKAPSEKKKIEKESRNVRLRILLYFCGYSLNTNQEQTAQAFRYKKDIRQDDKWIVRTGDRLVCIPPILNDDIQDDENTDVKTEVIFVNENSESDFKLKSIYMDSIVGKYCILYSKVIINIYMPSDNEAPLSPDIFFSVYCPKCIREDYVYKNIDRKNSFLTFTYIKQIY